MALKDIQIDKIKNYNPSNLNQEQVNFWKVKRIVPPITVRGISGGYYWLKDGSHRIASYLELNKKHISAKVI